MSAETTRTSLTEIVNSEVIADLITAYGIDATVITPLSRVLDLRGQASAVGSFPQWELDAVSAFTTEGTTTLSNVELQTTEVATITAGAVGILREVTDHALATSKLGADGLLQFIVEDGGRLCMVDLENSLASRFSGFTTTVGTSGIDLSLANFVEAISRMTTKNARGRVVAVFDDQQGFDLRTAVGTSAAALFGRDGVQDIMRPGRDGYVGELFGVPIWETNLTDTANTGADVVGAMFIDGQASPEYAGLGTVLLWEPKVTEVPVPAAGMHLIAITMAYGTGRISDFGVDLTTDA